MLSCYSDNPRTGKIRLQRHINSRCNKHHNDNSDFIDVLRDRHDNFKSRKGSRGGQCRSKRNNVSYDVSFRSLLPNRFYARIFTVVARVLSLTYVNDGLRAAIIFGNFEQALFNTALIVVLGAVCIIVGAVVTKWEEEQRPIRSYFL